MCGIVGVIAKTKQGFYSPVDDVFEEMLLADGVRGMDSTGVFMVDSKNKIDCLKQAVNPGIFLTTGSWKSWRDKIIKDARIVVGHNRKATMGEVVSKNAHPFVSTLNDHNIALVHNGFISNWRTFDAKADVDSAAVASALLTVEKPVDLISELSGAFALVWYDHKKRRLFITRNRERPLVMGHTKEYLFFASEEGMLKWVLDRENRNARANITEFSVDRLYEFSFDPYEMKVHDIKKWTPLPTNDIRDMLHFPGDLSTVVDDETPLPELERVKKQAEEEEKKANSISAKSTEELEAKSKELQKIYPFGSRVLFQPTGMEPDSITTHGGEKHNFFRVKGYIFAPGKPQMPAHTTVSDTKVDMFISPAVPLYARVDAIIRRNEAIRFNLGDVREQGVVIKDINGRPIGREEWAMVCDSIGCDECAKHLQPQQGIEYSSIVRTDKGEYSVICANCIGEQTKPARGGANGG